MLICNPHNLFKAGIDIIFSKMYDDYEDNPFANEQRLAEDEEEDSGSALEE